MTRTLLLAALLTAAGCASPDTETPTTPDTPVETAPPSEAPAQEAEPEAEPEEAEPAEPVASVPARPETLETTINVEGEEQPETLTLATFEDVPLPFSTYLPPGWTSEIGGSDEGTAVVLSTGTPPYEGSVTLFVPRAAPGRQEANAREFAQAVASSYGTVSPYDGGGWAREGSVFSGNDRSGIVRVGEHAGTWFYIVEEFQSEMGDGFAPRAEAILDQIRWLDDGSALGE